jgi:hypothetical protein
VCAPRLTRARAAQGKANAQGVRPPSWPADEGGEEDSDAEADDDQPGTPLLDASSIASSPPVTPRVVSAPSAWATPAGSGPAGGGSPAGSGGGSARGVPLVELAQAGDWGRTLDLRPYLNQSNISVRALAEAPLLQRARGTAHSDVPFAVRAGAGVLQRAAHVHPLPHTRAAAHAGARAEARLLA